MNDSLKVKYEHAGTKYLWAMYQSTFFGITDILYDQNRPAIPFDTLLVPIPVLLQSL
jgi:hypothetical protein